MGIMVPLRIISDICEPSSSFLFNLVALNAIFNGTYLISFLVFLVTELFKASNSSWVILETEKELSIFSEISDLLPLKCITFSSYF